SRARGIAEGGRRLVRTLVVAALVAACTLARAADEVAVPPITRATLDNGLRVVVAEYHELPLLEFTLIVGAGAAQDPAGKEGTAALVAGTLTKGAGKLGADELARAVESLGGRIGATPGTDGTIASAESLAKALAAAPAPVRSVRPEPTFTRHGCP